MEKTFKVTSDTGIHARPATALVNASNKFKSNVFAESKGKKVTMKSILGVLSLGLEENDILTLSAEGEDAAEAIAALEEIMIKEELGELHA
ncbi:HPr family phosphocarrier protein [Paenibacillus lutrae]|uniref:Phosphocarrier protein HPr n=1 Tax=Paenibacillus lutrae TaxID=2078573 RepID=A0A7X3FKQ1_9BACL|nr:HPr family phosphocarrier protein [Paenibacillus lutrae]MVP01398.1 HPr family phosphocarrier protein [Paenibacillus lutrae]